MPDFNNHYLPGKSAAQHRHHAGAVSVRNRVVLAQCYEQRGYKAPAADYCTAIFGLLSISSGVKSPSGPINMH